VPALLRRFATGELRCSGCPASIAGGVVCRAPVHDDRRPGGPRPGSRPL
jgi:hypothetical protein